MLKITSESGVSAGVRRIEAVTGVGANLLLDELSQNYSAITNELFVEDIDSRDGVEALDYLRFLEEENISFAEALNCSNDQVLKKIIQIKEDNNDLLKELNREPLEFKIFDTCIEGIENLMAINKSLKKDSKQLQSEDIGSSIQTLVDSSLLVEGYQLITSTFEDTDSKELREIADRLRNNSENSIIVLISISEDKAPAIVACSKDVDIDAREIMKHLINQLGGSGGGRSDFAQGGVENINDLDLALTSVADLIVSLNNQ
jgi:alanyl-tRNA synthetase